MSSLKPGETERIEQLNSSGQQTSQRVEKSLSRLDDVSKKRRAIHASNSINPAFAAIQHVFSVLGMKVNSDQFVSLNKDTVSIPDITSQIGGRARQIILGNRWHRSDYGPLVAYRLIKNEERIVSLIRKDGRYWFTHHDSGESGEVTNKVANSFSQRAYMLYPALPVNASKLKELGLFLLPEVKRNIPAILLAGASIALLGAIFPFVTVLIIDSLIPGAEFSLLVQIGIGLSVAAIMIFIFGIIQDRARLRIDGRTSARLQAAVWNRVLRLPTSFFKKLSSGDLNARIVDIEVVREALLDFILSAVVTALFSVFYLILLFLYLPQLAALAILLVLIFALLSFIAGWLQLKYITHQAEANGRVSSLVFQLLRGIVKLRVANAEGRAFAQWADLYADEREATSSIRRISNHFSAFAGVFQSIALAILFTAVFYLSGEHVSAGIFIAFIAAYTTFQSAFVGLSHSILSLLTTLPYLKRAKELLSADIEQSIGAVQPGTLEGSIQVTRVTFAYDSEGEEILKDLSFRVNPGEHVAIVGSSGSGKSTLLRVLLGFEIPQSGTVLYDGQDLSSLDLAALRKQIGVVLQTGRIFAGSIFDNIRGASDVSLQDCLQASFEAGLERDLEMFPMGLHTPLTEGATTLSGGQRQRILIARALVKKPRILFMDEATSALDNRAQAIVTENLENLSVTRIVIAHRLSTIRNADRIIVLDQGCIVESGSYEKLMENDHFFAKLARRQIV